MLTHNHRYHMASSFSFFNFNFTITNLILLLLLLLLLQQHSITVFVVAFTENNNTETITPPPTPIPIPENATTISQHTFTPFKPSVAIVISVFTVLFSVTFLLLLYIKHINNTTTNAETINIESSSSYYGGGISSFSGGRKNSGVDRSVVESLPIFKFGSLTGQKDGLDCAVCLSKFESSEVLRLLPKCKHAFHVECVDTWLEAHSTCPLCRYRVDPEDILLVMENSSSLASSVSRDSRQIQNQKEQEKDECVVEIERGTMTRNEIVEYYRKRHSSVGEKEWERERERRKTASFRWSLDSSRKKNDNNSVGIGLGCFVGPGPRKDGMLLTKEEKLITEERRSSVERRRRLEHRIIVSPSVTTTNSIRSGLHKNQRWSDVQPCDMLYLTSEMMIMSESRRVMKKNMNKRNSNNDSCWNDREEINSRSVSEITGFSRFQSNNTKQ